MLSQRNAHHTIDNITRMAAAVPTTRLTSPHYLVVANQTVGSEALLEKVVEISRWDSDARFTLLVPKIETGGLLTWTEGESTAAAVRTALQGRGILEGWGLPVERAIVGDESPVQAIADELASGRVYDAVVISTYPAGISRWLRLDVHARACARFNLPIVPVLSQRPRVIAA